MKCPGRFIFNACCGLSLIQFAILITAAVSALFPATGLHDRVSASIISARPQGGTLSSNQGTGETAVFLLILAIPFAILPTIWLRRTLMNRKQSR
jgi:hypothetical protein